MTAATPGQAAYEAYVMAAPDDMNFPVPDSLDAWERDAWEAAAQAGYEQRCQNDAAAREPHAAAGQSWTDSLPSRHVDEPVRVIEKPAPEPPCMTPAVARPYPGSTLVLAVGADTSDEDVAGAVEALTVATEGDGVTVVTVRGVDALRTWEPQPAPGLAAAMDAPAALARVLSWFAEEPVVSSRRYASATRAQLAHAHQDGGLTVPEELRRFL